VDAASSKAAFQLLFETMYLNTESLQTFTHLQSFSGMGGYIAASEEIIAHIRASSAGILYHTSMSPVVASQILRAFKVIMGEDGTDNGAKKLARLRDNCNYFRTEMRRIGLHVYGNYDSPIVPVMLYIPSKIAAFSRECLKRGLAIVVVGFPATSVVLSRARFCISAGHTKEDLDFAIGVIEEVSALLFLKYEKNFLGY
jgi:serine palmitoyltransferase